MLLRVGRVRWRGSLLILLSGILDGMGEPREVCSALILPITFVRWEGRVEVCGSVRRIFLLLGWRDVRLKRIVSWLFDLLLCVEVLGVEEVLCVGSRCRCDACEDFACLCFSLVV